RELLVDDLVAEIDALVADVDAGTGDELLDLPLRLAAEAAEELFVSFACPGHAPTPFTPNPGSCLGPLSRGLRASRLALGDDGGDDAVLHRLLRTHEEVSLHVARNLLLALPGVGGVDLLQTPLEADHLAGLDLDVGALSLEPAGHLMDQDP